MSRVRDWLVSAAVLLVGRSSPCEHRDEERLVPAGPRVPRAESWVLVLLLLATLAAGAFVVLYAVDPLAHRTQWLGLTLGLALACLAAACVVVGQRLVVTEELEKPYPAPGETAAERAEAERIVAESGSRLTRGRLLALSAGAAGGTLGLALVAPVLSLGPLLDTRSLVETPWRRGRRLVGEDGRPLAADAVEEGGFRTAFPQGAGREQLGAPVVVVRLAELELPEGREEWAVDGIVAYSKVCTHAGCAVSLFRKPTFAELQPRAALICPCHYSTFDPARGGAVLAGPAGRSLPQLPLLVDRAGNLRAAGNFSGPVGPSWWGARSRGARSR